MSSTENRRDCGAYDDEREYGDEVPLSERFEREHALLVAG